MNPLPRLPLPIGPGDLLPPGVAPADLRNDMISASLRAKVRFVTVEHARAVSTALDGCILEPDHRALMPGTEDVFARPNYYRLLARETASAAILVSWLGDDSTARDDEEIILSLDPAVAAVVQHADLIADPTPLLGLGGSREVAHAYPQDGRWLIESTCHRELRWYQRSPSASDATAFTLCLSKRSAAVLLARAIDGPAFRFPIASPRDYPSDTEAWVRVVIDTRLLPPLKHELDDDSYYEFGPSLLRRAHEIRILTHEELVRHAQARLDQPQLVETFPFGWSNADKTWREAIQDGEVTHPVWLEALKQSPPSDGSSVTG